MRREPFRIPLSAFGPKLRPEKKSPPAYAGGRYRHAVLAAATAGAESACLPDSIARNMPCKWAWPWEMFGCVHQTLACYRQAYYPNAYK